MRTHFIKSVAGVFSFVVLFYVTSCRLGISDPKAYLNYLADKNNGLVKEKTVAGITYKLKYLPVDYLAYNIIKETKGLSENEKDSIKKEFDHSVTFLLNIGPAENEAFDIMHLGVNNYAEFAERLEHMSFNAQEWISLRSGNSEQKPVIVRLENMNALEKSRNFIIVFSSEKNTEKDLRKTDMCLTYTDELFNTGTNKFIFKSADINALPEFKL